jgi:3-methyl-2-oxobutanoate hydroxymethyltransferase
VNQLSGFRVQGRGEAAQALIDDALAVQEAGAFALVLEMVPASVAGEVSKLLSIPTIGIGAGADCDGQVLVWTDMAGMGSWAPSFVKQYADLRTVLTQAATQYRQEVIDGVFPEPERDFS